MILPLVIASLIAGSASLNAKVGATLSLYLTGHQSVQCVSIADLTIIFIHLCSDVWNDRIPDHHLLPVHLAALRHGGPHPGGGHPAGEARGAQGDTWQW